MGPQTARHRGLWLVRTAPWGTTAAAAISMTASTALPEPGGLAMLIMTSPLLLLIPESLGWWLITTHDPAMPDPVARAARDLRQSLTILAALLAVAPAMIALGALTDGSPLFGIIAVVIAFNLIGLVSAVLARSAFVTDFTRSIASHFDTPALNDHLRSFQRAFIIGLVLIMFLTLLRAGFASTPTRAAFSTIMVLVTIWIATESIRFARLLTKRIRPGWGGGCQTCGYDLEGLNATKCPECGTPIEREHSDLVMSEHSQDQ